MKSVSIYLKNLIVLLVFLNACSPKYASIKSADWEVISIDAQSTTIDSIDLFLNNYRTALNQEMNVAIAFTQTNLLKAQPEGTLGNFMVDLQLSYAQHIDKEVSISVINYGGIRIPFLPAGPITLGNMYEIMPFENKLVIIEVPGNILIDFAHLMAKNGGWPIAGLSYQINANRAQHIQIAGIPLDENKTYKIATSDYLANGGDQCIFFKNLPRQETNILIRSLIVEELKLRGAGAFELNFELEERVTHYE